jgi:hydroxyacylglutathione hydrolase
MKALTEARQGLAMIGLDSVAGYFSWPDVKASLPAMETTPEIGVEQLAGDLRAHAVHVVDVRSEAEWDAGHLAGAQHIPLGELRARAVEIPTDRRIVVHCLGGTRSAIAASLLQSLGYRHVSNFSGGYNAWHAAGHESTVA